MRKVMVGVRNMPIKVLYRVAEAAADANLSRFEILSFGTLSPYSDAEGWVGLDEDGKSMSDPGQVAEKLGAGASTIRKSFAALERAGYIEWQRAWAPEGKQRMMTGKVRIILSSSAQQS